VISLECDKELLKKGRRNLVILGVITLLICVSVLGVLESVDINALTQMTKSLLTPRGVAVITAGVAVFLSFSLTTAYERTLFNLKEFFASTRSYLECRQTEWTEQKEVTRKLLRYKSVVLENLAYERKQGGR